MFHLIERPGSDNELDIIEEEKMNPNLGRILHSGEFSEMDRLQRKLRQPCIVGLDDVQPSSSKQSKYYITSSEEETDPYACHELSEDEYRPSSSSSSDSVNSLQVVEKVKRRLFEGDQKNSALDCPAMVQHQGSNICEEANIGGTLAVVTISDSKVHIEMLAPIHSGSYVVPLFKSSRYNGDSVLQGYIRKCKLGNHKCTPIQHSPKLTICDTVRQDMSLNCNLEVCCPKQTLMGYEKFIEAIGKHVAILTLCLPDTVKDPVVQSAKSTPSKNTKLKQHFCLYCGKLKTCLGRHLQRVHADKEEIKELMNLEGQSRKKALRRIRLLGDRNFNQHVKPHQRIPVRKPVLQLTSESLHCPICNALIARKNFSKHHLKCSRRAPDGRKRIRQQECEEMSQKIIDLDQKLLQQLLNDLQEDEVSEVIKSDRLIQQLGIYMSKSNRTMHQMKNSRAQMRRCARLLLIMRNLDASVHHFEDCMVPSKYRLIMNAIRILCEQPASGACVKLKYPTVALQTGPMLSTMISRLRRYYLEELHLHPSSAELQTLDSFKLLHQSEFSVEITRDALNTANTNKFHSRKELPKPADIQILREYCKKVFEENYSYLKNVGFDFIKWKKLGQVLLCQIMVFNRRRPGEISRTLLENYNVKKKVNPEQYESLNRLEIICADLFTMIHIKGKKGKILSILLQPDNIKGLDLYISLRKEAGISEDNPYLFAYANKEGYLSASNALKIFTDECGAENPKSLTGTYLRKQAATMCQLFNLTENELKQMADFMGHTFDVHLNHYRMPEQTTQIINISRFLSVVGDKDVYKYRGKSWEELQPFVPSEDNEEVNLDELEPSDSQDMFGENYENNVSNIDTVLPALSYDDNGLDKNVVSYEVEASQTSSNKKQRESLPKIRQMTPQKQMKKTSQTSTPASGQKKKQLSSPRNSIEMLNLLANPSNRTKICARKIVKKKRWNEQETSLMESIFGEFLKPTAKLPKMTYVKEVFRQHRDRFQGRTPSSLYAWIQNQKNKV